MLIKSKLVLLVMFMVAGCATSPEQQARWNALQAKANYEPTCSSESECKLMWDKAVYFVSSNARMAIRNSGDNIVETYASNDMKLHAKVNKVPLSENRYRIESVWGCGNMFGCSTNPVEIKARFNEYLRGR